MIKRNTEPFSFLETSAGALYYTTTPVDGARVSVSMYIFWKSCVVTLTVNENNGKYILSSSANGFVDDGDDVFREKLSTNASRWESCEHFKASVDDFLPLFSPATIVSKYVQLNGV